MITKKKILPPTLNSGGGKKKKERDTYKEEFNINRVICKRFQDQTHLVVDFVEGVLQFPVNRGQFFKVSVGFMDRQQNFVHFIYGFIHGSLESEHNIEPVFFLHRSPLNVSSAMVMPACHHVVRECESYHVKRGSCLLQEAN